MPGRGELQLSVYTAGDSRKRRGPVGSLCVTLKLQGCTTLGTFPHFLTCKMEIQSNCIAELVSESHRDTINVYSNLTEITKRITKTQRIVERTLHQELLIFTFNHCFGNIEYNCYIKNSTHLSGGRQQLITSCVGKSVDPQGGCQARLGVKFLLDFTLIFKLFSDDPLKYEIFQTHTSNIYI